MSLPQVRAFQMPDMPEQFVDFLAALEDFDQLSLSTEDLRRAEYYDVRRKQEELAQRGFVSICTIVSLKFQISGTKQHTTEKAMQESINKYRDQLMER